MVSGRRAAGDEHGAAYRTCASATRQRRMRLTIVAATGGIGSQLLRQAVAAGHEVTAVVRDPRRLPDVPVRVVAEDLAAPDPARLVSSLDGADAVLSGLGARSG